MKTITLVAYRRPEYLAQVLESIAANKTVGYSLVAVLDGGPIHPGTMQCKALLENFDAMPKIVYFPLENLGINYANRFVYQKAIELGSEINVAVEDDTPLSPDCLDMVNWLVNSNESDRRAWQLHDLGKEIGGNIGCPTLHRPSTHWLMNCFSKSLDRRNQNLIVNGTEFCPWVWAASGAMLRHLVKETSWMCDEKGWDFSINKILKNGGTGFIEGGDKFQFVEPIVSRASNIGRLNGVNFTTEYFDEKFKGHVASDGICREYKFK